MRRKRTSWLALVAAPACVARPDVGARLHPVVRKDEAERVFHLAGSDFIGRGRERRDREPGGIGGRASIAVVPLLVPLVALSQGKGAFGRPARSGWTLLAVALFAAVQAQYAYFAIAMKG